MPTLNPSANLTEITAKLKRSTLERKTSNTSTSELVAITTELYPQEIVLAAQTALTEKVITPYYLEMYEYAIACQSANCSILTSQYNGVLLTHNKITKFLASMSVTDAFNINDPFVMKTFLKFHTDRIKQSTEVFEFVAAILAGSDK
ncbi:hypothetical protein [Variovorax sp. LG9.2]|uniref:hypothetical protein n=1 Tax=Variovorax sp. LG9.2 TaxID=3048626 RepID=UPI002B23A1E6|nr:hypothetical protein [Variovorax sp. LG9.2]MEB0057290.1 hypothetical protein [Variovorax sp. LG9.2]